MIGVIAGVLVLASKKMKVPFERNLFFLCSARISLVSLTRQTSAMVAGRA